jgi:hypothetical protein
MIFLKAIGEGFSRLYKIPLYYIHVFWAIDIAIKKGWDKGLIILVMTYSIFAIAGGICIYAESRLDNKNLGD